MTSTLDRIDPAATSVAAFQSAYPAFDTDAVEELRAREYARLDARGDIYLDYTGASLYAESQVRQHLALLAGAVLGNPHSTNPTSLAATVLADQARAAVLAFVNAPPDEYVVVFTPNASGALKLVGEAFPFAQGGRYLLSTDNHNSVNGIREFARARGAATTYLPLTAPELRLDEAALRAELDQAPPGYRHLFAYPAQSNLSGVQHPLAFIDLARERGWNVLLDAASFAPTNRLDLGRWKPDFVSLSFYKLFGYPTGVGCLIARREALAQLRRPWFAGGTITISSVLGDGHYLAAGEAGFEDGTISFLNLPAVEIGLRHLTAVGLDTVQARTRCLTDWLLAQLTGLCHPDGAPLIRVYGPTTTEARGGTVTFNVLVPGGRVVDYRLVEALANQRRISLRTGCFCNPGASEVALGWSAEALRPLFHRDRPVVPSDLHHLWPQRAIGAVRVSVGIATTPSDVARLIAFLRSFAETEQPVLAAPAAPGELRNRS
jgi:selenocysteine lyase/cysteine desulfurase